MTDTAAPTTTRTFEGATIPTPGTFVLDASHTTIGFIARHLVVTKVRGSFDTFEGAITVAEDPLASSVEVSIDAASFDSRDEGRDGHVKGADFLDVENFPTLTFRSTGVRNEKGAWKVDGDLTVKSTTKPVVLDLELGGVVTDPWGGSRLAFSATTQIDRDDYGINFNVPLDGGGMLVGKKIVIEIDGQGVRQDD